ncbi:hypothetical protein [Pontibacter anaerobius]|uniref:Uncharacterized protein n=1 Tax=Pontibacter anaerobius TaxID=2993940 RepID=A0ABT3RCC2_9BACT|nr:hypothetical protein [Pontibacter anaerobius]MCX2739063.1 hypothetical protein [Pontibacter anaerobius]
MCKAYWYGSAGYGYLVPFDNIHVDIDVPGRMLSDPEGRKSSI